MRLKIAGTYRLVTKGVYMLPVGYLPCTQDPPDGKNMARVMDEVFAEAAAAEAAGWDRCFITEHHQQPDGYVP